ncbi:hypothetical protein PEC18_14150 [Paucibacter sp. O1-1]|nr:hypothetical protein [Paucibacter sp. O1-1]MDA3826960.1 hypothetical protein [Paucibacter sp. O1-1]
MQSTLFAVNDEPFCLWEADLPARTRAFLDGIDPEYFDYVLQAHMSTEDEKRALVAIRLSLHHATETIFSLLGAFVQAPDCPYAWIAKCSNTELREFAERVSKADKSLITKLAIDSVNWTTITNAVYSTYQPGTDRQRSTIDCFARLWTILAGELLNPTHVDEYNALKHGFRARPGGFALAAGVEPSFGVSPPDSEIKLLGQSDFGATFLKIESLGSSRASRHIRSRQTSVNWSLERVVLLHQLVYMSINNVVSALKVVNGYSPSTCRFLRPENDSDFQKPWAYGTGVTSINIDHAIDESRLPAVTKAELLSKLKTK